MKTLNDLNAQLAANNLQAIDRLDGRDHDHDHERRGLVDDRRDRRYRGGRRQPFAGLVGAGARCSIRLRRRFAPTWSSQYNNILQQITTTSQDASFNGINLLNGDELKLTFNETGKSTLNIKGVTSTRPASALLADAGTDFLDNASANATI